MKHDTRDNPSNRQPSQKCTNCYTAQISRRNSDKSTHYDGKRVCYNCYDYAQRNGRKRPLQLQRKLDRMRFNQVNTYTPELPSSRRERTRKSPTPDIPNNNDSHIESDSTDSTDSDFSINSGWKYGPRKRRSQANVPITKQSVVTRPQSPYSRRGSTRIREEKLSSGSKLRRGSSPVKPFITRQHENRGMLPTAMPTSADQEVDASSSTLPDIRKEYAMLLSLVMEVEMVSNLAGIPETQACIEAALDLVCEMLAHQGVQSIIRLMELLIKSKLDLQAGNMERMMASMKDCRKLVESHLI